MKVEKFLRFFVIAMLLVVSVVAAADTEYTITYNANGGQFWSNSVGGNVSTESIKCSKCYNPTPQRSGYDFLGWYTSPSDGSRVQYGATATSDMTLYAHWKAQTYTVNLKHANETSENPDQIKVTYGQKLPQVDVSLKPVRAGYKFLGYQRHDGKWYYDENMQPTDNVWDFPYGGVIEAKWEICSYTITVHAGEGAKIKTSTSAPSTLTYEYDSDGNPVTGTFPVTWKSNTNSQIKGIIPLKPGYVFCGWYTKEGDNLSDMVFRVNDMEQVSSLQGTYWSSDCGNWQYEGNLDLYPEYRKIYTNAGNEIDFYARRYIVPECLKTDSRYAGVPYYAISSYDVKAALENDGNFNANIDLIDITTYMIKTDNGKQSLGDGSYPESAVDKVMQVVEDYKNGVVDSNTGNKNKISANVLTFYNGGGTSNYKNVCYAHDTDADGNPVYQCDGGIKVTDRVPMSVKYQIISHKCYYDRELTSLGKQAQWGTICLPFDFCVYDEEAKDSISFYKLAGIEQTNNGEVGRMTFERYHSAYIGKASKQPYIDGNYHEVIQANTPLIYHLNKKGGGSKGVGVHSDNWQFAFYVPVCAYDDQKSDEMIDGWRLVGTRTTRTFCGEEGTNDLYHYYVKGNPDGYDAIYYITYDKTMGDNGDVFCKVGDGEEVKSPAYRAYFAHTATSAAKCASRYSLMAFDEDGNSTDITNLLDNNEAVGDGKIYDLNGMRVKNPLKGHIYIVNGKKKVY